MDENIISDALNQALYLIQDEFQSVIEDELRDKYLETIELLKKAIKSLEENQSA